MYGVSTDSTGNVYIVGATQSPDFPVTANAYQPKLGGQWDVFLMTLSPVAASLPASVNVQPQVLTFTGTGGPNQPPAQTVSVTAAAGAVITTSVSTASGGNWLSATLNGAAQISVAVNTTGLAIGTYHGTVSVSTGGGTPASVSVTLNIPTAAPVLTSYSLTTASTIFPALQPPLTIFGSGFLPGASAKVYLNGALGAGQPNSLYIAPPSVNVVDSNTVQFFPGVGSATPITIAVTVTNTGSLESNALPILLGAPSPLIVGVQNAAAASQPNTVQPISPGEMITITGTDFGSPVGISAPANSGTPSTQLGSTRVLFNGIPVPVTYVSFAQINAVAPFSISGGVTASIVVEYVGVASAPLTVQIVPSMTGLLHRELDWQRTRGDPQSGFEVQLGFERGGPWFRSHHVRYRNGNDEPGTSRWNRAAEFVGETSPCGLGDHRRSARPNRIRVRRAGNARHIAGFRSGASFRSHGSRDPGHAPGGELAKSAGSDHGDAIITG